MATAQEIFDAIRTRALARLAAADSALVRKEFRELAQNIIPAEIAALPLPGALSAYTVQQALQLLAQFIEQERAARLLEDRFRDLLLELQRQVEQNERAQ